MKNFVLTFFFLSSFFALSQKRVILLDSITKNSIEYVNIKYLDSSYGTLTDSMGVFMLDKKKGKEILVSVLGYKEKKILTKNIVDTILLKPKNLLLDEIIINNELHEEYGFHKKKSRFIRSKVKRVGLAVYIENKNEDTGRVITSINYKIRKRSKAISVVRAHLYTINKKTKKPDIELLDYNLLIRLRKRGLNDVRLDVSDKNISFPKDGIFVALEWVDSTEFVDFGYSYSNKQGRTFITSFDLKKIIWTSFSVPPYDKNKIATASFGITVR